jgi:hypothetical protein
VNRWANYTKDVAEDRQVAHHDAIVILLDPLANSNCSFPCCNSFVALATFPTANHFAKLASRVNYAEIASATTAANHTAFGLVILHGQSSKNLRILLELP